MLTHPVLTHLDIRQLQMIAAIVDRGGITDAARVLGVTPSALSHRLREAERRLGFVLFDRTGKTLRPTPAGTEILNTARVVLAELRAGEAAAVRAAGQFDVALKVGSRAYACYRWLPAFLAEYRVREPRTLVELHDGGAARPLDALREGAVDVAIASGRVAGGDITATALFEDRLLGILPPDHPRADAPWLNPEDFADEVYVTYSMDPEPGHEYDLFFRKAALMPRQVLHAGLTEAIIELVHHGFGVSILTGWAARRAVETGHVQARPLTETGLAVGWSAVVRASDPDDAPSRQFVAALADWCRGRRDLIGYAK